MRVAQMIGDLAWGGTQELLVQLAAAARGSDVELSLITLQREREATPYRARLAALGVEVLDVPGRRTTDPLRALRLARLLRQRRFTLLHTHLSAANIVGAVAGRAAGLPVVGGLHLTRSDPSPRRERLEAWALRRGARLVTACGSAVAEIQRGRLGTTPIVVVPNGVSAGAALDPAERDRLRAEIAGDPAPPLLIAVGRLAPEKGLHDLLGAAALLRAERPSFRLCIVGDGPLAAELAARIATDQLRPQVVLAGPRDDVPRLLAASDLYVSAALSEGLSIALLEAMAAGLPVVATDTGDHRELLRGAGLVVAPGRPGELATRLAAFLDDAAARESYGAAARTRVAEQYSVAAQFARLRELYHEVAARFGRPAPAARRPV